MRITTGAVSLALVSSCFGAITNARVLGTAPAEIIIGYTAPSTAACTIAASESPALTPVVPDVDATKYVGGNSDGGGARSRIFVIGKRKSQTASDGKVYSRALQNSTLHYIQITCGADTAGLTAQTPTIPFGLTRSHEFDYDPANPGNLLWPSRDFANASWRTTDPHTGALVKPFIPSRYAPTDSLGVYFNNATDSSGTWTNPSAAATGSGNATYSGTAGAKLFLQSGVQCGYGYTGPAWGNGYNGCDGDHIDYYVLHLPAYSNGTTRNVSACFTKDGTTCAGTTTTFRVGTTMADNVICPGGTGAACSGLTYSSWTSYDLSPFERTYGAGTVTISGSTITFSSAADCNLIYPGGNGIDWLYLPINKGQTPIYLTAKNCATLSGTLATSSYPQQTNWPFTYQSGWTQNPRLGFLVWKADADNSTLTLGRASQDVGRSAMGTNSSDGGAALCDGSGMFTASDGVKLWKCMTQDGIMYGLNPADGSVRMLGANYYLKQWTRPAADVDVGISKCSGACVEHTVTKHNRWAASTAYAANSQITQKNYSINEPYMQNSTACTSGATEPAWPYAIGATVADGSCTWTVKGGEHRGVMVWVNYSGSGLPVGSANALTSAFQSSDVTVITPDDNVNDLYTLVKARAANLGISLPANWEMDAGAGCSSIGQYQNYAAIYCKNASPDQNSMGWLAVFDLGNKKPVGNGWVGTNGNTWPIFALTATYDKATCRWCGFHAGGQGYDAPIMEIGSDYAPGRYTVTTTAPVTGCTLGQDCDPCPTNAVRPSVAGQKYCRTFQVTSSWNPAWGPTPAGFAPGEPISSDPYNPSNPLFWLDPFLQTAQPGDWFIEKNSFNYWQILTKTGTTWVCYLNAGSTPAVSTGSALWMASMSSNSEVIIWNWLASKDGTDPNNFAGTAQAWFAGHHMSSGGIIGSPNYLVNYPITQAAANLNRTVADLLLAPDPNFAGAYAPCAGQFCEHHPSKIHYAAPTDQYNTFFDQIPFLGMGGPACTLVEGSLYKCQTTGDSDGLSRKQHSTLLSCGYQMLTDVSGPASHILATDTGKACVALRAGECRGSSDAGGSSSAGDVFINCPLADPDLLTCGGFEFYQGNRDMCVFDQSAHLFGATQTDLKAFLNPIPAIIYGGNQVNPRDVTDTLHLGCCGSAHVEEYDGTTRRVLTRMFSLPHNVGGTGNTKPFPDASWLLWWIKLDQPYSFVDQGFLVKIPPVPPYDTVNRSSFVPIAVQAKPPAGLGVVDAVVEFGYDPATLYCGQRQEMCVATQSVINEAAPFYYPSEGSGGVESGLTGVPCSSNAGCSIAIPAISSRTVYYRIAYRAFGGGLISRSQIQAVAVP